MTIADFQTDVNDTTNATAETIVFKALQGHFKGQDVQVRDVRDLHLKWDFVLTAKDREYTLDVKCDRYIDATKRFAFEMFHIHDGEKVESSWGLNPRLDFIAVIPDTFRYIKIVPLQYIRAYVALMQKLYPVESLLEHHSWKEINVRNRGRMSSWVTHGWAIPLAGIEEYLTHSNAKTILLTTPPHLHKKTGPRLLVGGREVA